MISPASPAVVSPWFVIRSDPWIVAADRIAGGGGARAGAAWSRVAPPRGIAVLPCPASVRRPAPAPRSGGCPLVVKELTDPPLASEIERKNAMHAPLSRLQGRRDGTIGKMEAKAAFAVCSLTTES